MKTKNFLTMAIFTALFVIATTSSCKKDKTDKDDDVSAASENALAENTYADVHSLVDQAVDFKTAKGIDSLNFPLLSGCATITHDTIAIPHTILIDFGTTNCLCGDNRYRRGEVHVSYTGKYRDSGTVITVTFNNYFVNDNKVMGTKTITNLGKNTNGNWNYSIQVNGSILKSNGGTVTWTSTRNREWIAGANTNTKWDDVYLISGSAAGTNANGKSFTVTITNPLRKEIGCKHFTSGIFDLNISGKATRTIDYGTGTCDALATVTINGVVYNITLN